MGCIFHYVFAVASGYRFFTACVDVTSNYFYTEKFKLATIYYFLFFFLRGGRGRRGEGRCGKKGLIYTCMCFCVWTRNNNAFAP